MSDSPMVERRARIFRFGHYPRKNWGITREEFVAANGEAGTIPIGLDPIGRKHYVGMDSVLDGLTGEASFSVEGDEVFATLRMPELIDRAARSAGLKVSGVFHPTLKTISKIDLVDEPHIRDAVIFAEEHGEVVVFEGEEPEPPTDEGVEFCDGDGGKHEAYQSMHDLASHGRPHLCGPAVGFADGKPKKESDDDRLFRQIHHHAVHEGAFCPGMPDGINDEEIGMSDEIDDVEGGDENGTPVEFADETPREKALRLQVRAMQERLDHKDAVAFADSVIGGREPRATAAERPLLVEAYKRAAADDALIAEPVTFSEGGRPRQGSRVEAFKALINARPRALTKGEHVVFSELAPEPGADTKKEDDEWEADIRSFATRMNGPAAK